MLLINFLQWVTKYNSFDEILESFVVNVRSFCKKIVKKNEISSVDKKSQVENEYLTTKPVIRFIFSADK